VTLLRYRGIVVPRGDHLPQICWQKPLGLSHKLLAVLAGREMKCRVMFRSLPILAFRSAPGNPGVTGCLCVLTEGTQATKHRQIVGVNSNTKMKLFMRAGHDYCVFSLCEFARYLKNVVDFHLKQSQSKSGTLNQIDRIRQFHCASMTSERLKVKSHALQPLHLTILASRGTTSYGA